MFGAAIRRRVAAAVLICTTVPLLLMVVLPGWAAAHAELIRSTPEQGARLDRAPTVAELVFSEPVNLVRDGIRLLDGRGEPVSTGEPRRDPAQPDTVRMPLPALADGVYTLSWRVVSADTHPVAGAIAFSVGAAAAPTSPVSPESATDPALAAAGWAARWVGYAGIALLVGGAVFVLVLWPAGRRDRRARALLRAGGLAAAGGTVGALLVQGPLAAGRGFGAIADPALLGDTLRGEFGQLLVVRLALLAAVGALVARLHRGAGPASWAGAAVLGVALLFTWAVTGHARTGAQVPLALATDTAHLAAMCTWVGGLALLTGCLLARHRGAELAAVLPRFSRVALGCVGVLVVTGSYQAWRELYSLAALTGSDYGRLLLVKLGGFAALLALGAFARSVVQRRYVLPVVHAAARLPAQRVAQHPEPGPLRRSVALEVGIAAVVLGLTAALVATPPPQGTAEPVPSGPYTATLGLPDGGTVQLQLSPARRGRNELTLLVRDPSGGARDVSEVSARLRLREGDLGPLPVQLTPEGPGRYRAPALTIPLSGEWRLDTTVRVSDIDAYTVSTRIPVP